MALESVTQLEPPPRPWRLSSRLLVVDDAERLLVIRARDPSQPAVGEWWEVPGGGVEAGEGTVDAAVRETAEETGIIVPVEQVGPACWQGETTYVWAGQRYWASLVMHLVRLTGLPHRQPLDRMTDEQACFLDIEWLPVAEVAGSGSRFFPESLPADLPRLLAGESVRAPFSVWS